MIKTISLTFFLLLSYVILGQASINNYLQKNSQDFIKNSNIEIGSAKIIGFAALHGSAKTEDAELLLIHNIISKNNSLYYFMETDYATALYFQKYIETGDESLLKDLILAYGSRVPQEASIEVYEKWKKLRSLFKNNHVKIIGIDKIASYKFSVGALLENITDNSEWVYADSLREKWDDIHTNWTAYYSTETQNTLKHFVDDYTAHKTQYTAFISDTTTFNHIIKNIQFIFNRSHREKCMYKNYKALSQQNNFSTSLQFFRLGVFHIMKSRINNSPSFFSMLIENNDYKTNELISIQAFLTKSEVLWNLKYDKNRNYKTYTTKAGYGISDYWLEHYQGIKSLKKNKTSDFTLFQLNHEKSPYSQLNNFDLVVVKKFLGKSYWNPEKEKSTIDYIDYALLISNSEANTPIESLDLTVH